ncbi:flagellin, partial [Paenarthrobacter sp. RAF9]
LGKELDRITQSTNFNGIDLLKGGSKNIQVGTAGTANDTISVNLGDVATAAGTLSSATGATGFDVTTNAAAQTTITAIDAAITTVSAQRSDLGANQNRLDHAIKTLNVSGENLQAAQSRIADTDMAAEMVKYTKANILSQAGTAMLAQANQSGQGVLSLLR